MANRVATFTQNDVKRFSLGIRQAGYEPAKIAVGRDGRLEATFTPAEKAGNSDDENSWDHLIVKSRRKAVQS